MNYLEVSSLQLVYVHTYIYIYMYTCVCVCLCVEIGVYGSSTSVYRVDEFCFHVNWLGRGWALLCSISVSLRRASNPHGRHLLLMY